MEQAQRLCSPITEKAFCSMRNFRVWILSLAIQLSELCEMDHTSGSSWSFRDELRLRPFKAGFVTLKAACEDLRRILNAPLRPSEKETHGMGYVYIIRNQGAALTISELKIGFSKFHPEHRAHELASCFARPEVVAHTPRLPHAKRLESIIHTELQGCRKILACPKCDKNHQEWFTVSHADSREVVARWSRWILQRPYLDGNLTDEWRAYLATKDFDKLSNDASLAEVWQDVVTSFSPEVSAGTRLQRSMAYLEECYFDVLQYDLCFDLYGLGNVDEIAGESQANFLPSMTKKTFREQLGSFPQMLSEYQAKFAELQKSPGLGKPPNSDHTDCQIPDKFRDGIPKDTLMHDLVGRDTPFGLSLHPSVTIGHFLNPGSLDESLCDILQCRDLDSEIAIGDMEKFCERFQTIQTGCASVSDPVLGITESPLGDATLLPILACSDLELLHPSAANWLGISPTHAGFQYVQEAYQAGKWTGRLPRFRLPKHWEEAWNQSSPIKDTVNGPSVKGAGKEGKHASEPVSEPSNHDRCTMRRTLDGIEISVPLDDRLKRGVKKIQGKMESGGYAKVRKQAIRAFHRLGIDTGSDPSDSEDLTDSDLDTNEPEDDEKDGMDLDSAPRVASPSIHPKQADDQPELDVNFVTQDMAKKWFT